MAKGTLDFYFDIVSPYAYVGLEALYQYEDRLPYKIDLKPVSMVEVFKRSGNTPPAMLENKATNMWREIPMLAQHWGVPYKNVTQFQKRILGNDPTLPHNFLTVIKTEHPTLYRKTIKTMFERLFVHDTLFHTEADIREICNQVGIPNPDAIIAKAKSPEAKAQFEKTMSEIMAEKAFGVPWIVVKQSSKPDLVLYGSDRMHILCEQLGVKFEGPLAVH